MLFSQLKRVASYPMPNRRLPFLPFLSTNVTVKTELKLRPNLLVIILMAENMCVGKLLIITGLSLRGWNTFLNNVLSTGVLKFS